MKFVIVLGVLLVGVWLWRRARRPDEDREPPAAPPAPAAHQTTPAAMVACQHCGMHLPASDALRGARGSYCSAEHRRLAEGDTPR